MDRLSSGFGNPIGAPGQGPNPWFLIFALVETFETVTTGTTEKRVEKDV